MMKTGFFLEGKSFFSDIDRELGVGDDALPYVGDCLISVADGAGSRGAKRLVDIDPDLTDPEKSFDIMLEGCDVPERYREQYDENFRQLYELGPKGYAGMGGRKSSYFGSRLTTILMRQIVEETFSPEKLAPIFDALARMQGPELDMALDTLEKGIAETLGDRIRRAARNMGLRFGKSEDAASNLMSTTYSGIVFYEDEDCVHFLSIQAGDSMLWAGVSERPDPQARPWLALRQLLPAQERADGVLSNTVNIDSDFYLRCAYHRVPKPCFALVASDGCFDYFDTQIHFERFMMNYLMRSKSLEDAGEQIANFFSGVKTGDDSSTMAIAAFGFDDYDQLIQMANRRQKFLYDHYQLEETALYSRDETPETLLQVARVTRAKVLKAHVDDLWKASPWLRKAALARGEQDYPARLQAMSGDAQRQIAEAKSRISQARGELEKQVRAEWFDIRRDYLPGGGSSATTQNGIFGPQGNGWGGRPSQGYGGYGRPSQGYDDQGLYEMIREQKRLRERLESTQRAVSDQLRKMADMVGQVDFSENQSVEGLVNAAEDFGWRYKSAKKELNRLLEELEDIVDDIEKRVSKLENLKKTILRDEKNDITRCAGDLDKQPGLVDSWIHLPGEARRHLLDALNEVNSQRKRCEAAEGALEESRAAFARQILAANPALLIECYEQHRDEFTGEAARTLSAALADVEKDLEYAGTLEERKRRHMDDYEAQALSIMMERS